MSTSLVSVGVALTAFCRLSAASAAAMRGSGLVPSGGPVLEEAEPST